jgi:FkbM family methyltransferase
MINNSTKNIVMRRMKNWIKSRLNLNQQQNQDQTQNKNVDDCLLSVRQLFTEEDLKIVFDVGAHEGTLTKAMHEEFPNILIYAFEPFPNSYKKLSELAETSTNIKSFPFALSSSSENRDFFVNNFSETNSLLPSKKVGSVIDELTARIDKISIQTLTLNQFCEEHGIEHIDLLKLDTQGSELEVLKGSSNLLGSQAISAIYCEVEFMEMYENQPLFDRVFHYLNQYDYVLYNFYNMNYLETGQLAWADAFFISKNLCNSRKQIL